MSETNCIKHWSWWNKLVHELWNRRTLAPTWGLPGGLEEISHCLGLGGLEEEKTCLSLSPPCQSVRRRIGQSPIAYYVSIMLSCLKITFIISVTSHPISEDAHDKGKQRMDFVLTTVEARPFSTCFLISSISPTPQILVGTWKGGNTKSLHGVLWIMYPFIFDLSKLKLLRD